jgi:hypothetical protein
MAAKPPYIKSRSDFIGAVPARFCDARRGATGVKISGSFFLSLSVLITDAALPIPHRIRRAVFRTFPGYRQRYHYSFRHFFKAEGFFSRARSARLIGSGT